jgi:hypothetical protein
MCNNFRHCFWAMARMSKVKTRPCDFGVSPRAGAPGSHRLLERAVPELLLIRFPALLNQRLEEPFLATPRILWDVERVVGMHVWYKDVGPIFVL